MPKIILTASLTANYVDKARPFLSSLNQNSNFDDNVIVLFGDGIFDVDESKFPRLVFPHMRQGEALAANANGCIQHGDFINCSWFKEVADADIIVGTDADIEVQRGLTDRERGTLEGLRNGDVMIGDNEYATESLSREAGKLGKIGNDECASGFNFDIWKRMKIYNTGVIAANKQTWESLCRDYVHLWPRVSELFSHQGRQQWLISWILQMRDYNIVRMPISFHAHGHRHPKTPHPFYGFGYDDSRRLYVSSQMVLFRHAV
jgi:hypothetical protein